MAGEFVKKIMYLTAEDPKKNIDVYINSCGGEIISGLTIYDAIVDSIAPEEATAYDHYFSPEESIAFGLCDHIIGFHKMMED